MPAPNEGNVSAVHVTPSTLTAPLVPAPIAKNLPFCAAPTKSKSTIAPVTLLTDVTVIVISLAVLAPPTADPRIVNVSKRA